MAGVGGLVQGCIWASSPLLCAGRLDVCAALGKGFVARRVIPPRSGLARSAHWRPWMRVSAESRETFSDLLNGDCQRRPLAGEDPLECGDAAAVELRARLLVEDADRLLVRECVPGRPASRSARRRRRTQHDKGRGQPGYLRSRSRSARNRDRAKLAAERDFVAREEVAGRRRECRHRSTKHENRSDPIAGSTPHAFE